MAVQITIRNVPDVVRDELASRAARAGQSMQEYLRSKLEHWANRPSLQQWADRVREQKALSPTTLTKESILEARDADRR